MLNIFVSAMGRINVNNRDGSEVRFQEIFKRFKGVDLEILLPEREYKILKEAGIKAKYHVLKEYLEYRNWTLPIYFKRFVQLRFFKPNKKYDVIYSPSDFLIDLLPAVRIKKENSRSRLIVWCFLIAPNPIKGYKNRFTNKRKFPTFYSILYYLSQRYAFRLMKKYADKVLVLNSLDKNKLINLGFKKSKVEVVTMGVDVKKAISAKRRKKGYDGVFLGRLHAQKGVLDLIKIWRKVVDKIPDAKLAMIFGGADRDIRRLKNSVKKEKLSKNIDLLGFMTDKKFSVLKASKVFLMPSYYESFGQVAAEAMACGLPIVAYKLPVYKGLFGEGMKRVKIGDTTRFGNEVIKLIKGKFNKNISIKNAKMFDWDEVSKKEYKLIMEK